jgi:hypothetical protein
MFRDHWLDAIWCSSRRNSPRHAQKRAVATYHYDNQRTGWNGNETKLTPANVGSPSFGVLAEVVLDDQVGQL